LLARDDYDGRMPTMGTPELILTAVITLIAIAIPVVMIVVLARASRSRAGQDDPDPAMDVLRTRFAAGQIDQVEFERLRSILQRR
jgi:uncharacterized membrane protein